MSINSTNIINLFKADKAQKKTRAFGGTREKKDWSKFLVAFVQVVNDLFKADVKTEINGKAIFHEGKYLSQNDAINLGILVMASMAPELGLKTDKDGKLDFNGGKEHFKTIKVTDEKTGEVKTQKVPMTSAEFSTKMAYNTVHAVLGYRDEPELVMYNVEAKDEKTGEVFIKARYIAMPAKLVPVVKK